MIVYYKKYKNVVIKNIFNRYWGYLSKIFLTIEDSY